MPERVHADPLIDEVRAIRRELSERFGNDVDRLCDHLETIEKSVAERLVSPPATRPSEVER